MIPNNASIVRKAYEDFAKGDIPAVLEAFDPSITWHESASWKHRLVRREDPEQSYRT